MKKDNRIYYLLSFLIPIIIMFIMLLCKNMVFNGTIFISDMQGQYISLFNYLKNVFNSPETIMYSFSKGIGGSMIGSIFYYLSSPLNLIILFFSKNNFNSALIIILLIKIGLSGLFMNIFLKNSLNKYSNKNLLIFSSCYALMGYSIAYYFHLMWLDCIFLTPLVMLGIIKLVKKESGLFYGITLFITILSNYYIGYMVCIFSFLFLTYNLLLTYNLKKDKKQVFKIILKFLLISFLSILMTSALFIPTIFELLNTNKADAYNIFSNFKILNILEILKNMLFLNYGYENVLNQSDTPLIYCGVINLILLIFYIFNKNINKKEKILSLIMIVIFILSFSISSLNNIWHGFNVPMCFNYRYAFLYCFFIIYIGAKSFFEVEKIDKKIYLLTFIIIEFLTFYFVIFIKNNFVYINLVIALLYLLIIYLINKNHDNKVNKQFSIILIILVLSELLVNSYLITRDYNKYSQKEYVDNLNVIGSKINNLKSSENDFYRIEKNFQYTYLDSFLYNNYSLSTFLSTVESNSQNFMKNIGIETGENNYNYNYGENKFSNSILGVKYYINKNDNGYYDYKKIDEFKFSNSQGIFYGIDDIKYAIYENQYQLNLGYMISNKSINFVQQLKKDNVIDKLNIQNAIFKTMINSKDSIFKKLKYKKIDDNEYEIEITNKEDIYISFFVEINSFEDILGIYVNDKEQSQLTTTTYANIKINNIYNIGDKIKVKLIKNRNFPLENDIHPYYFDDEIFNKFYKNLSKNQLNITSFKDTNIKGTITSTKNKNILFTTIPYDKGWTVLVDGKKAKKLKLYDTFLGVELEEGKHDIEFSYFPPGLKLGIIVSSISVILFIIYFSFENKKNKILKK